MAGFRRRRLSSVWREIPDFGIFQHAWEGLGTAAKVLAASAWSSSILLVVLAWGVDDLPLGSLLGILAGLDALGTLVLTYINVIRRNGDQHVRDKLQHALTYIPFCATYVALVCAALCASVLVSNELLQDTGEVGFSLLLALSGVGFLWAALIPWTFLASLAFEEVDEKSSKHVCLGQIVGILFYFVSAVVGLGISYLYSAVGWAGVVPTVVLVTMIVWLVCRVCLYKARNGRIIPIVFGLWLVFVVVCACNPEDDWPKVEALTLEDQDQRNAKWLPLILGVGTAGVLLGTGLTWLRDRFKRRLSTNVETGTKDLQRLLRIITVPAVITTQVLALKVALYFNLTTKSQSGGLPFEGWLLFTTLSLLWLFTQTGESSNLGSNRTFGLQSFGTSVLSTIIPYFAEPFDVVKDAQFAAACCSSVSRVSQVVGILSLNCIVISFIYRFKLEEQWLSMEESYVGFLHLKLADMVTASYWTRDPAKLAWREFLFSAYRRTLPAKQAWLVTEGAVQIPLTIIYLFAQPGSQKMILAMSVILPLIRLALVIPLRPFLLRRVAARVAVEFATAKAADIEELEMLWMQELHELNSFDGAWQATAVIELAEEVGTASSRILENLVEVLRRVPQPVPEVAILELCRSLPGSSRLGKKTLGPEDLQRAKQLAKVLQALRQRFPEAALVELCTATKYALEHPGLDPKLLQSLAEIWHSRRKQGFLGKAAGALKEVLDAAATSPQLKTARESAAGEPVSKGLLRFSKDLVVICCTTARSQAAEAQPPCNVKELLAGELFATRESGYQDLCSVIKKDLRDQVAKGSKGADLKVLRTQHQLLSNLTSPKEAGEELCRLGYWAAVRAHHLGLKAVVDILREQEDFHPEEASIGELCSAAAWDSVNKQEFAQRATAPTSATNVPEPAGVVDVVREWLKGTPFPELAVQQILQAACLVAVKEYGKEQAHLAKSLVDVVKELRNRAPSQASLSLSELLKELVQLLVESLPQVQAIPTECLAHACKEAAKLAKLGKLRGFQGAAAFVDALSGESFPPESLQELCQAARQALGPAPAEAEVVGSVATLLGVLALQSQLEQVCPDGFADLAALAATACLRSDLKDLLDPLQKVLGRMVTHPLPPEPLASFSCAIVEARETTYAVDNLVQMLRCLLCKGGSEDSEPSDSQEASPAPQIKTAVEHLIALTSPVKALESLHQAATTAQVEPFALWKVLENKSAASPPLDADLTELCVRVSQEAAAGDFGKITGQVKFLENLVKWRFPIDALPSLCSAAKCAAEAGAEELSGLVSTLEGQKELVLMWQERGDGADDLCAATVWAAVQGLPDFAKLKQLLEWLLASPWQEGSVTLKQALSRQPQMRPLLCRGVAAVTVALARDPGAGAACVTYMTELLDLLRDDSAAREISSVGVAGQAKDFVQRLLLLTTEGPLILELGAQALEAAKNGQVDHVVAFVRLVEPLRSFKPFPKGCVADLARAAGWLGAENCFVSFEEVLKLLQALPEDAFDEQGVEHFGRAVRLAALRGLDPKLLLGLAKSFGNLGQQEKLLKEVKEDIRSGEKQHLTESLHHLKLLQEALEHPVS